MIVSRSLAGIVALVVGHWPAQASADLFVCYQNGQLSTRHAPATGCKRVAYSAQSEEPANESAETPNQVRVDIFEIQRQLKNLGYAAEPVDGIIGEKTTTAIRAFQTDRKLTIDGRATPEVAAALAAEQ